MKLFVILVIAGLALSATAASIAPEDNLARCAAFFERLSADAIAKLVDVCARPNVNAWFCACTGKYE